jgi:hypothetical protein
MRMPRLPPLLPRVAVLAGTQLLACSASPEDVRIALQQAAQANLVVGGAICGGAPTLLRDVLVTDVVIHDGSGTATISGTNADPQSKGKACNAKVAYKYVTARSTTQSVNGESSSYTAVVSEVYKVQ